MHTLTKIFIVLQALLSVFVLALVVPFAVNENTWKNRYETALSNAQTSEASVRQLTAQLQGEASEHANKVEQLESEKIDLEKQINTKDQTIVDLRARLGIAQQDAGEVRSQLDTLTATTQTQASIIQTQAGEIGRRREESLELNKRAIELEDRNRELSLDLQVAVDATRIMQEQVARLNEQIDQLKTGVTSVASEDADAAIPSPPVQGRIVQVRNDATGRKFAVVNLGSRDGLEERMRFYISREIEGQGRFLGFLELTSVDINRAVGRVDLEQSEWGGVQLNDVVRGGVQISSSL